MAPPPDALFRLLFDRNPVPMWVADAHARRVLAANESALTLAGASSEELVALEPDGFARRVEQRVGAGEVGRLLSVTVSSTDGEWVLTVVLGAAEGSRAEEKLRQAQKFNAIGRLAGGVAHDFNNILTAVLGFSDLALSRLPEGDPLKKPVGEIRKAGERAAALTRQLLAFSQRQMMSPQTVDLNALLAGVVPMLRRVIGEKVAVTLEPAPEDAIVLVDPGLIEQCVYELALNARDAMPEGGTLAIRISVRAIEEAEAARRVPMLPGRYVVLEIKDSGAGIEPDLQKHLFEPFFTTKPKGTATGMGLATVYGTVKQSGGFIFIESEPESGTCVQIHLPLQPGLVVSPSNSMLRAGTDQPARILVVEDEELVRTLVTTILTEQGHKVLAAADGAEALSILRDPSAQVEMILTDVVMPGMDGPEVVEAARALRPGLPALFMSGYADSRTVKEKILDRGLAFLQKPFTRGKLVRKVREVLGP